MLANCLQQPLRTEWRMRQTDQAAELLRALAEPSRLRLVALLREHGTLCVCELEQITGLPQYTVSRHLGLLRRLSVLENERQGARIDYRLARDLPPGVAALIDAALALLTADPQLAADRDAARALCSADCCLPTP